jgi:hypothetical protein
MKTTQDLRAVPGRAMLAVAIGVACPAVEAWYLCGRDDAVSEAAWERGMATGVLPYDVRELKRRVYGTDRPSRAAETETAVREATRLSQPEALALLESRFPIGFGTFARDVRRWVKL